MSKIIFDDGVEVEISAEIEKDLRSLVKKGFLPIITICDYDNKRDRIIVRLNEVAIRRVKNGKKVLVFNKDGDITDSYDHANSPFRTFYKNPINYGQLKEE